MPQLSELLHPSVLFQKLWRKFPVGTAETHVKYDIWDRPNYAYGVYQAARLAQRLGLRRISAVEFGVAGGAGLLALERISRRVGQSLQIEVEVIGFDTGNGLPRPPIDFRDHPYLWDKGYFRMDIDALGKRLKYAKLKLGDVADTIPAFMKSENPAPLGFISFDLDYYSSTLDAFEIFSYAPQTRLPRLFCYFDDVIEPDWAAYNSFCGELRAIEDFNSSHDTMKITKMQHLHLQRAFPAPWNEQIYVFHDFYHPDYNSMVLPPDISQLRI